MKRNDWIFDCHFNNSDFVFCIKRLKKKCWLIVAQKDSIINLDKMLFKNKRLKLKFKIFFSFYLLLFLFFQLELVIYVVIIRWYLCVNALAINCSSFGSYISRHYIFTIFMCPFICFIFGCFSFSVLSGFSTNILLISWTNSCGVSHGNDAF